MLGVATTPVRSSGEGVIVAVWAVPGSSRTEIVGVHGGRIKVRVSAPPEGGRANSALVSYLEDTLGTDVELVAGMASRSKLFRVKGLEAGSVRRKLGLR